MEVSLKQHLKYGMCWLSAVLLISAIAFGGGFQLNEHGARAMAQGGAFAARASDPSAIYFNPAGLAGQGTSLYFGATFIMPKVSFFGPIKDANDPNIQNETKMVDQTFTPINLYATYAITPDLNVGFGVMNPYGLGTEWDPNWVGKYITTKIDLSTFYFTPTIAYKITDQLSIGVGANIVTGGVKLSEAKNVVNTDTKVTLDMTAKTAYGFNVGLQYKLTQDITLGASYRSSVKIDASGPATFDPNFAIVNVVNDNVSASLELPATAFVGLAYKILPDLEVEADYQFIGWSSYKELNINFQNDPTKDVVSPKNYQDTYMIRVGGEYTMDALKLRAGYLYDHSPVPSAYVEPLLPDANRNGINIGAGYQITKELSVDISYLFLKFDQRKAENTAIQFDGTYNMSANLFGIDLGYSF
jgi:long-chain fatty acid transport protein